jgi:hypothetical protein
MKLNIPEIGTKIKLKEDWKFNLFSEDRNEALVLAATLGVDERDQLQRGKTLTPFLISRGWQDAKPTDYWRSFFKEVTLPKGSILTVDRIYIRKGAANYSSVSFHLNRKSVVVSNEFTKKIAGGKGSCRFWAKLECVNKIIYEEI